MHFRYKKIFKKSIDIKQTIVFKNAEQFSSCLAPMTFRKGAETLEVGPKQSQKRLYFWIGEKTLGYFTWV